MTDRIRKHITKEEAYCRCGCGLIQGDIWLDVVDTLIDMCGFQIGISTMARCIVYNRKVGGVEDSPHLERYGTCGAADLKCWGHKKRMVILKNIMILEKLGEINQIEICDGHVHIANVPMMHRLYESCNWGKSKT